MGCQFHVSTRLDLLTDAIHRRRVKQRCRSQDIFPISGTITAADGTIARALARCSSASLSVSKASKASTPRPSPMLAATPRTPVTTR